MITEFKFIQNIKRRFGLTRVGDDCAVLPKDDLTDSLLTADLLIEDIDFRLEWTTPEFLGHKALAVSLSDIAAMGGSPTWAMLSLGISEKLWKTDFLNRFYAGWFELARNYDVELIGGDISRSPDKLVIDSIVGGQCPRGKAVLRSGAQPGDSIYTSGTLGGAAGGLELLKNGERHGSDIGGSVQKLLLKQLKPSSQVSLANSLRSLMILRSMIDVSDGVSSEISHICAQSGVGAKIYPDRLPIDPDLAHHFSESECLDMALHGGEDYELLFTADGKHISVLQSNGLTCIGEITENAGSIELIHDGMSEILHPKGHRHF